MGQAPKTSFIPKQATGPGAVSARSRKTFNVLTFISTVVFLAILILSIGVFFYKQYNESRLTGAKKELSDLRDSFEAAGNIDSIRALERKMKIGEYLLDQHISLTRLFDALEARVQSNASISSLQYVREPSGLGRVTLRGTALTFNTVALQERGLTSERVFEPDSVLFSGLNTSGGELVTFTVDANLDPKEVSYQVLVPEAPAAETAEGSSEEAASSTDGTVPVDTAPVTLIETDTVAEPTSVTP